MLNWTTKGRLKLAFDIGYVWNKPGALWRCSPGTCLGPKSLSSNVAAQKTFSQIGVSVACDCTKTAVKLKFSSWGHNKKLIFYKTCTLDNNGTLIELRDLKHSVLGRLPSSSSDGTKTTTTKNCFLFCFPMQNFLPLNASQVCMD